ncbi:HYR domain-containing protein, partial [Hugenholtzia roseola]|uniref:HYR domain-containing protein n=1 Tax=Hugenholtzia roseola TaxID=1002 RepID=UPI00054EB556
MKTKILYLLICLLLPVSGLQAQWTNVGTAGFSAGAVEDQSLAFHPTTHEPYIAYRDNANGNKTTVMRYDGTNWVNVGTAGFSGGGARFQSLAFHPTTHEPYVAYRDDTNGDRTTVMRYNGTSWVNVGIAGFSAGASRLQSLAFHPTTYEPYVAYRDIANGFGTTVMRYNGTNWVNVGIVGFSAGQAEYQSLAFHPTTNEPYVAYRDNANGNKTTVMRFDGTNWVNVGTAGFSAAGASYQSLAFHPTTHEPYVAYSDFPNGLGTTVMRFDGTNWMNVGTVGFSVGSALYQSLAFHPTTNEPYVAYRDNANSNKTTVMRFDGTNWVSVGTAGFSAAAASYQSLAFHPTTYEPYVAYRDAANSYGTTVLRFVGSPNISVLGNSTAIVSGSAAVSAANHTDFGSLPACVGTSQTRTFTIQNTGSAILNLTGTPLVSMSGAGAAMFSVNIVPASSIAPSLSSTFEITYLPTAAGTHEATVSIVSDDPDTPNFTFLIRGVGTNAVNPLIVCPTNITVNNESPICAGTRVCYPFPTATDNCLPYSAPITGYTYLGSIGTQSYYISNTEMDYPTGLASCKSNGGYMAQIGDATEDAQLRTWVTAHFAGSPAPYFVGFTDLVIEGTFVWEDCSNMGYTNWAAGEPNNWAVGGEHATTVLGNGQWNDYPSYFSFRHILELNGAYITQTAGLPPNSVFPIGTTTNTFTVTDAAGNTNTCSFDVVVNPFIVTVSPPPTFDCPANISVSGDPLLCGATVTFPTPSICDAVSIVQTAGLASGSVFPDGVTTNTFVVTYTSGATSTCSFTVTVNVPPTLVCPADVSVNSDPNVCGAVVNYSIPTYCADFTISQTSGLPSGSLFPVGTTINNFVLANAAGNIVSCSFTVTVADTNSPAISCPTNISTNAAVGTCAATVTYPLPTFSDECVNYSEQNLLSTNFTGGVNFRGNMFDLTAGALPVQINSFRQRFGGTGTTTMLVYYKAGTYIGSETDATAWTLLGTATVTSPGTGAVVDVPIGGLQIPAGAVYGIYITTNGTGPSIRYSSPMANTYSDANLTITTGVGKEYPFGATFSPRTWNGTINYSVPIPNTVVVSQTAGLASGSVFPVGTTTNTFVVTDLAGNTATCSFDVTVADSENPTITCPANISVNNDAGVCGATVTYTAPTFADNCAGATVSQTAGLASGAVFPVGTTTNTFVVTDLAGNTATCSFDVTVTDNQNPTIACPANISVNNDAGVCGAAVAYTAPTFADNCAGATVSQTAGLASGAIFPVGTTTNTFIVTDLAGNTATCSFDVTVTDNQNPTITCPANISVNNDAGVCGAAVTYTAPTFADNCAGATVSQTAGLASGSVFPVGTTTNTFVVTDLAGNTATCSFDVIVTDNENPTITCPANISVNNDAGVCGATVTYTAPTFADNCAGATVSQTAGLASGAIFPIGTTTNTFVVTDLAGNTATCSFDVTVTDNQNPTITAPAAVSVNADAGLCTASGVALGTPTTADNCTFAVTNNAPATFPLGNTTVTWTVSDGAGNTATATQVVNVSFAGTLTYSTSTFTESTPTSGQMGNSITITAPCPIFAGANGDDFVANGWVSVTNIPAGLTAEIIKIDDQTLSFSLVGNASPHTPNENVTDLTVAFDDNAFLFGSVAANIVGSNRNDLVVDFKALVLPNLPPCPTVENLAATPLSSNSILLTWDLPVGVEYVEVYLNGTVIANLPIPQSSFVVENLSPSTLHHFEIRTLCNAAFSNMMVVYASIDATTLPTSASLESVREVCGSGRVVLSVSGKTDWQGIYRWYENETDTTPIFESANGIFETPILTESKTYFVSIFELGQEGEKVPVIALVNEAYEA